MKFFVEIRPGVAGGNGGTGGAGVTGMNPAASSPGWTCVLNIVTSWFRYASSWSPKTAGCAAAWPCWMSGASRTTRTALRISIVPSTP